MPDNRAGRNIWFGVREHAMAAMMNGIALAGVRLRRDILYLLGLLKATCAAAISQLPVTYVLTHDSVAVGEDGPTHGLLSNWRLSVATPHLNVIRPADVRRWQRELAGR